MSDKPKGNPSYQYDRASYADHVRLYPDPVDGTVLSYGPKAAPTRFPTYPPDILSRADAMLAARYGTEKPIDPLLVEIACEAMMMEQERVAKIVAEHIWDDHALAQATDIGRALHQQAEEIAKAIEGTE